MNENDQSFLHWVLPKKNLFWPFNFIFLVTTSRMSKSLEIWVIWEFKFQYFWQPKAKSNSLCEAVRNPPVRGPASNLAWCAAVPCSRRRSTYFSRSRHRHALLSCVHAYILNTSRLFWLSLAILRNWLSYSIQGLEMNRIFMYYTSSAWPRAWFH